MLDRHCLEVVIDGSTCIDGVKCGLIQDRARVHNYNFLFSTPPCVFSDVKPDQQRDCSRKAYRGPHLDTGGRCQRGGLELLWQGGGVKKQKIRTVQKPQNRADNKFYGRYVNRRIARKRYGRYRGRRLVRSVFFF